MTQRELELSLRDEINEQFTDEIVFNQNDSAKILDGFSNVLSRALLNGDTVRIPGVGTLRVDNRNCRNPSLGGMINSNVLKFKASEVIKKKLKNI